jgi:high-affinity nickel permease
MEIRILCLIIVLSATILLSLVAMGCIMYSVGNEKNSFHRGLGVVGILLGAGLAYLLKGLNTCAVINIAKIYVNRIHYLKKDIG